jgi:hypothetical protein
MTDSHFEKTIKENKVPNAVKFIKDINKKGIPVSAIDKNDWSSSPNTIVYITIPYGSKKNSGKNKKFKNSFGDRAVSSALEFWKSRI